MFYTVPKYKKKKIFIFDFERFRKQFDSACFTFFDTLVNFINLMTKTNKRKKIKMSEAKILIAINETQLRK